MEKITTTGVYKRKSTGEQVNFNFSFISYASLAEAIEHLGEQAIFSKFCRQDKVDAGNASRVSPQVANGDLERKVMTAEEKAESKADRLGVKNRDARIKAKAEEAGMSVDDYLDSIM